MTAGEMKERLNEVYKDLSAYQSELSENSSARYVLCGSFHTNGVQLYLDAINTRVIAEHKYIRSENRHKSDMKLMLDHRIGYGSYLRG
ncbi:hypothetical protein BGZ80_006158, partial [Entomortierella chlamydospora]